MSTPSTKLISSYMHYTNHLIKRNNNLQIAIDYTPPPTLHLLKQIKYLTDINEKLFSLLSQTLTAYDSLYYLYISNPTLTINTLIPPHLNNFEINSFDDLIMTLKHIQNLNK